MRSRTKRQIRSGKISKVRVELKRSANARRRRSIYLAGVVADNWRRQRRRPLPGYTLVREADPELERLLREEEMISRRYL